MMSDHKRHGRMKPYTATGIARVPCFRCGSKASQQWSVCADGNLQRPVCGPCDIDLNRVVLEWAGDPQAAAKVAAYVENLNG